MKLLGKVRVKNIGEIRMDDLIQRQGVLDLAKKGVLISNGNYGSVCKVINDLPSVNPTKTGHWTYLFNSRVNGLKVCECDACKKRAYGSTHFCPNCGARMESEEEK